MYGEDLKDLERLKKENLDRLRFDLSKLSEADCNNLKRLEELLEVDSMSAFAIGGGVYRLIREEPDSKAPYEGWFPQIKGAQRERLYGYITAIKYHEEYIQKLRATSV